MKFSYGKGSDSFVQRSLRLEKLKKCGFKWVSSKRSTVNYNDEIHPNHKCRIVAGHKSDSHRCNCGASKGRRR